MGEGFEEFIKNPYWKKHYESAPTKKVKKYVALEFDASAAETDEEDERYSEELRGLLDDMSEEEVSWLCDHTDSQLMKSVYKKKINSPSKG